MLLEPITPALAIKAVKLLRPKMFTQRASELRLNRDVKPKGKLRREADAYAKTKCGTESEARDESEAERLKVMSL